MSRTPEAHLPLPSQRTPRESSSTGLSYMVSSQDLRSGLDVRLLAVAQPPAELLRELQRLRDCWQEEVPPTAWRRAGHALG